MANAPVDASVGKIVDASVGKTVVNNHSTKVVQANINVFGSEKTDTGRIRWTGRAEKARLGGSGAACAYTRSTPPTHEVMEGRVPTVH